MEQLRPAPLGYQPLRSARSRRVIIATLVTLVLTSSFLNGRYRSPVVQWFTVRSSFREMLRGGVAHGTFDLSPGPSVGTQTEFAADVYARLDVWTRAAKPANDVLIDWVRRAGGYSVEEAPPFFLGRMRAADGTERFVRITLLPVHFQAARLYLHVELFAVGTLMSPTFAVVDPALQARSRIMDIRGYGGPGESTAIAQLAPGDRVKVDAPSRRENDPSTLDLPIWFGQAKTILQIHLAPSDVVVIRRDDDQPLPISSGAAAIRPATRSLR